MYDLLVKNGHVVDALNGVDTVCDVAIAGDKVVEIGENLNASSALEVLDCEGKYVLPGIIDMHTHMRTLLGHPHAQRMLALAGVTWLWPVLWTTFSIRFLQAVPVLTSPYWKELERHKRFRQSDPRKKNELHSSRKR